MVLAGKSCWRRVQPMRDSAADEAHVWHCGGGYTAQLMIVAGRTYFTVRRVHLARRLELIKTRLMSATFH